MKIFVFTLLIFTNTCWAFPSLIEHGYTSCNACHHDPQGGGLLTEYGKGVSQALSLQGGQYREGKIKKWLRAGNHLDHAFQFRYVALFKKDDQSYFPMQADYLLRAEFSPKISSSLTLARIPEQSKRLKSGQTDNAWRNFIIRKGVIQLNLKKHQFIFGRDFLPLGVGVEDHTAFVRERNRQGVTDFKSLLTYHYDDSKDLLDLTAFAPSFQETNDNKEYGVAAKYLKYFQRHYNLGGQLVLGKSPAIKRSLIGLLARTGFKGFSLNTEVNYTYRDLSSYDRQFSQWSILVAPHFSPLAYLGFTLSAEYLRTDKDFENEEKKFGLESRLRFTRWLSLLADYRHHRRSHSYENIGLVQLYLNGW